MRKVLIFSVLALTIFVAGGIAAAIAYKTGAHVVAAGALSDLRGFLSGKSGQQDPSTARYASIFTPLSAKIVKLGDPSRSGSGGALTAFGDTVIHVDFDGTFRRVYENGTLIELPVSAPENGFSAYKSFANSKAGQDYTFDFEWFRYNDVHFAPDYQGGTMLLSYTFFDKDKLCYANRVSKLVISAQDIEDKKAFSPGDWKTLYTSQPCLPLKKDFRALEGNMAGGRFDFDDAGMLYLGNGDYAIDEHYSSLGVLAAQEPGWEYGAMVAIDVATGDHEILSRGHRNIQGVSLADNGSIWAVEHGMRGGDELNLIRKGSNYGWPLVSYGTAYSTLPLRTVDDGAIGSHDGFDQPELAFLPSVATGTMDIARGLHPAWEGDILIGTLRTGQLIRVRYDYTEERVIFAEFIEIGPRIRDIEMLKNGALAMLTDSREVQFLRAATGGLGGRYVAYRLDTTDAPSAVRAEAKTVLARCMECHSLERGDHESAPSLAGLMGRKFGSTTFSGYSAAMMKENSTWTSARLEKYLANPDKLVPGTQMQKVEMSAEARALIVSIISGMTNDVVIPPEYREKQYD